MDILPFGADIDLVATFSPLSHKPSGLTGRTIRDSATLRMVYGSAYIKPGNYNRALVAASKLGYSLTTEFSADYLGLTT